MAKKTLEAGALQGFRHSLYGKLLQEGDADYEAARGNWNGMVDKRPALIVCCANAADVIGAVRFARSQGLPLAVRGGGHSVAGKSLCDDGMVIDLAPMKGIIIDSTRRTARVQAGLTLGEFMRATHEHGLATTTGVISTTGVSGLTLGGGIGWLMGKYGLACDNVRAVDIVTADGELLSASPTRHPDLFWAVRGGGGNFGVVTTFEFQLHPLTQVLAGLIAYPIARAREVLHFYREFTSNVPDELTVYAAFVTLPNGPPVVALIPCYCGDLQEGERLLEPIRKLGEPMVNAVHPMSYPDLITMLDDGAPKGHHYYEKSSALPQLSDEVLDILVEHAAAITSPLTEVILQHVHGAACRVEPDTTATSILRHDQYLLSIVASWMGGQEPQRHIQWARDYYTALEPFAQQGIYTNFLGNDEKDERVQASYGPDYARLVAIKNTYDPDNIFRLNQNIQPTVTKVGAR
ncbi:MAG: FAD-binding oxidoreductase [Ktedonobacteraceae bacterium]